MTFLYEPTEDLVLKHIATRHSNQFDIRIEKGVFKADINENGNVVFNTVDSIQLKPTNSALSQLLNKHEIPAGFFSRCPPDIKKSIFAYFCDGKEYLLRGETTDKCRAVLSKTYPTNFDDHILFPEVIDKLNEKTSDHSYLSFEVDEHFTVLTVKLLSKTENLDIVPTIKITNSETGHSAIWVEPSVTFISNGVSMSNRSAIKDHITRRVHKGTLKDLDLDEVLDFSIEVAQVGVIQILSTEKELVNRDHALAFVDSIDNVPKRFVNLFEQEWAEQQALTKLQVSLRMLEAAKELPLVQKMAVEQAAGKFVGLFKNLEETKKKLVEKMEQLSEIA
jgi:hypothetical protein